MKPIPLTMVAPGQKREGIWRGGVIQIHVTRSCDKACTHCTQGSNLRGRATVMTPEQFEQACLSLRGYFGVVGVFGGNPCIHPQFEDLCRILRSTIPFEQRGLWSNNLLGKGAACRITFNPAVSNLNVHLDQVAAAEMRATWPEAARYVKGVTENSRHVPPFVAMKDVLKKNCPTCIGPGRIFDSGNEFKPSPDCPNCNGTGKVVDENRMWDLISKCDVNQRWSALIGVFRGELRAWFCELAGAQSMLHQDEPDYPDTGLNPTQEYEHLVGQQGRIETTLGKWWQLGMTSFEHQVRKHCPDCGIPLRSYGGLAVGGTVEQVSQTHLSIIRPKDKDKHVEEVTREDQLKPGSLPRSTDYVENSRVKE